MTEYVSDQVRDEVMSVIASYPGNNICFDCSNKNPTWASANLGLLICMDCSARHRSYGTHISFVRSIQLDKWNKKQLKTMELAGNQYARLKFNDLGVSKDGPIYDYNSDSIQKYKNELSERVKQALSEMTVPIIEKKVVEAPKDDFFEEPQVEVPEYKEPTKIALSTKTNTEIKLAKTNKIKKVDIDFDFDNFNDTPFTTVTEDTTTTTKKTRNVDEEYEEKEKAVDKVEYKISKEEINKKFANKKAISSEDYQAL
jgi:hypothetical protein